MMGYPGTLRVIEPCRHDRLSRIQHAFVALGRTSR